MIRKYVYFFSGLFGFNSIICNGQESIFLIPEIPKNGKSITEFIPANWNIRDSLSGDFNKDNLRDVAVVIQSKQPLTSIDTVCFSNDPFYPKALIILLRQQDKSLQLSKRATKIFGDCNWGIQGSDPFDRIEERRNTIGLIFMTGGTTRNQLSYYFRFQNNDWYLIGAESFQYWAGHTDGPGSFYSEEINFLTSEKVKYNADEKGNKSEYKKTAIGRKPLIKLSDFSNETIIPFDEGQ